MPIRIRLGTVNITPRTKELMAQALDTGMIGQGPQVAEFECGLAQWFGVKHVMATANGTTADAAALAAVKEIDQRRRGRARTEVIVPALTFIAQVNAVRYNHLTPVFVDVGADYQIDVVKIPEKITGDTLAIMPTHLLGKPAAMRAITALARAHNLFVIEDACEALGSAYFGAKAGTIGDVGCFSFYVSHSITTGEGGAAVTNDDEIAELIRSKRSHGRKSERGQDKYVFPHVGFSGKMNSLEAIIGLGMLPELDGYVARRNANHRELKRRIGQGGLGEREGEWIVPHGYPVMLAQAGRRDELLIELPERHGIEARQIFSSIPTQCEAYAYLGEPKGAYPVAEDIGERGLYLPCHQNLSADDIAYLGDTVRSVLT